MLNFQRAYPLPGISSALETVEKEIFWGIRQQQKFISGVIDGAARDSGNTSYTDILRPGLLMGKVTSTGKLKEWNPTLTDGTEVIEGVLLFDQKMQDGSTNVDRWFCYLMVGGNLKATSIIPYGATSYGINGTTYECLVRAQLTQTGRFILDDELRGNPWGGWIKSEVKTADYSVVEADNNTLFHNTGDGDTIEFTLPAPAVGLRFGFFCAADYDFTVTAATAGQIIADNDTTADAVAFTTGSAKVGRMVVMLGVSATKWLAQVFDYAATPSITGDLDLPADLLFTTLTTGGHDLILKDNQADALSIKDDTGGADLMVFCTTNAGEEVQLGGVTLTATDFILNSTNALTIQIGTVDILQLDDAAISGFAAAGDTAGQAYYQETEDGGTDGGTASTGMAGGAYSHKCGDGSAAVTTNAVGGAGGGLAISSGAGAAGDGSGNGGAGGTWASGTGAGGTADTGVGGAGGAFALSSGAGGAASGATGTGGAGGQHALAAGAGGAGAGTGAAAGGVGGLASLTAGIGGAAAGTSASGAGGAASLVSGAGGAKTGTTNAAGGAGGALAVTGGAGGATASNGADAGGAGAAITLTGGVGGAASAGTGNGGIGGDIILTPGNGGATTGGTAGVQGIVSITDGKALFIGPKTLPATTVGGNWIGFEDSGVDPVGTVTNSVILYPQSAGDDLDALHADGTTEAILT